MGNKASLSFWKSDWFVGLMVSVLVFALGSAGLLHSVERKAYDVGVGMAAPVPSDRIAVIAIDRQSLEQIGAWPWSREVFAGMIEKLATAQTRVIATTLPFAEPQRNPALDYLRRLRELHSDQGAALAAAAAEQGAAAQVLAARRQGEMRVGAGRMAIFAPSPPEIARPPVSMPVAAVDPLTALLAEAEEKLDGDRRLARAFDQAGNIILPVWLDLDERDVGQGNVAKPEYLSASAAKLAASAKHEAMPGRALLAGVAEPFAAEIAAAGHGSFIPDVDGILRGVPLVIFHADLALPALALQVAARSLNLLPAEILVRPGDSVRLGKHKIATDAQTRLLNLYYPAVDGVPPFPVTSFSAVMSGQVPLERFRDKIVLIGPTVMGFDAMFATPGGGTLPAVLVLAHSVSNLLAGHYIVVPAWGGWAGQGVFVLIALYLMFLLPRLSRIAGVGASALLLLLLLGAPLGLLASQMLWLPLLLPATLLLVGHLGLAAKRCLLVASARELTAVVETSPAQSVAAHEDALHAATLVIPRAEFSTEVADKTLVLDFSTQNMQTLGRYRIEGELGKGAMGLVYLGRDRQSGLQVALKTLALEQEFDADELADVRARFFREAETIARLDHPNIVRVLDAGEEQGLAYIAMEFLSGQDLLPQTRPDKLLPLPQVASIIARVADALDYAHAHHVVHRDIKPANIMYEPRSDQVKVTDFGVARITDASKTRTGMVLGTPSYMSPEQLAGKKIDGRSDLFSLGVALYQLCCGKLPFVGESMAKLMFKIASAPHADIRDSVPNMPECLAAVIDKLLVKDPARRYQTGAEVARDLRACQEKMEAVA